MSRADPDPWPVALATLRLANRLVDAIQDGVRDAGHGELRPAHGFAFMHIEGGGATTATLAEYLGVTKQAAAQLVERVVRDGYVERMPHPADQRARLLRLTSAGRQITEAAERAAVGAVESWRGELAAQDRATFERALLALTRHQGAIRPTW